MNISSIIYSFHLWYYNVIDEFEELKLYNWLAKVRGHQFWREWWIVISALRWSWLFKCARATPELNKLIQFSLPETENSSLSFNLSIMKFPSQCKSTQFKFKLRVCWTSSLNTGPGLIPSAISEFELPWLLTLKHFPRISLFLNI